METVFGQEMVFQSRLRKSFDSQLKMVFEMIVGFVDQKAVVAVI